MKRRFKKCRDCGVKQKDNEFDFIKWGKVVNATRCNPCREKHTKSVKRANTLRNRKSKKPYTPHNSNPLDKNERRRLCNLTEEQKIKKRAQWKASRKRNSHKQAEYVRRYRAKYPHRTAWRSMIRSTYRRIGKEKVNSVIEDLGYSAEDLKTHMESLFKKGMSWENHGEWHIDHIRPVSSFSKDDKISDVNALSNLQPLWKKDNFTKGKVW